MTRAFQKPKRLICDLETLSPTYGHFFAQPFERGFGTTIGNALRRVLLSSIEGAAITAVRIEGVLHEFTPIPNVTEDATNIIMNLKQVPLKLNVDHAKTIYLESDQPGVLTSGNITPDPDIEILDPNIHIATIGEGGKLKIEMRIKKGRGYIQADENFEEDLPLGYIPLDSVHSPIKRVNYSVEAARLGQTTDYDKLVLDVWTNGCIPPQDAIAQAAKIVKDHMFIFINFEEQPEEEEEEVDREAERMYENLKIVAQLSGRESEADALIESLKARVQAVSDKIATNTAVVSAFYELDGSTDPTKPWTTGKGTFLSQLIAMAGGVNIGDSLEGSYAQMSQEELLVQDPEVILLGDAAYGVTAEQVAARSGWTALQAVKNNKVYAFDDDLVSRPGPRLVDGLETLAKLLHPELFE